jgi:hypothetical protein
MSAAPVQPSPLAATVIALLQGTAAAAPSSASAPRQTLPSPAATKPMPTAGASEMRPLRRGSLVNIIA